MGTSISQPSPKNSNWKRVLTCYENAGISEARVVNEVWKALDNENIPISDQLKSDTIYSCFQAVNSSSNFQEALQKFNSSVLQLKGNSLVAEFAKRAIPVAFQSPNPGKQWIGSFFSEVTSYAVSRDVSGFVGEGTRNKSVKEMMDFKRGLSKKANDIVLPKRESLKTRSDWNKFIDTSVNKLKSK